MQITKLVVKAGKTVSNPHERFSNLRSDVVIEAIPDLDDHWDQHEGLVQLRAMQEQADEAVESELRRRLAAITRRKDMEYVRDRIESAEREMKSHSAMAERFRADAVAATNQDEERHYLNQAEAQAGILARLANMILELRARFAALEAGKEDPGETPVTDARIGEDEDGDPG